MKKKNNYYKMLLELSKFTVKCSDVLHRMLLEFDYENIAAQVAELHEIEHESDMYVHEINQKLAGEFITPIEREDISLLVSQIDDVVDSIEDISLSLYIYNVNSLKPEIFDFMNIISDCGMTLENMMLKFEHFRKSKDIFEDIIKLNELENKADEVYQNAIKKLFSENNDTLHIVQWNEIFKKLENCCDSFEEVASLINNVIIKNS